MKTIKWQYNGAAPWNEIVAWCREHLGADNLAWQCAWETIYFEDPKLYTLFLLRWR